MSVSSPKSTDRKPAPRAGRNVPQRGRTVPPRRNRRWLWIAGAVLVALPLLGIALANRNGATGAIEGVTTIPGLEQGHSDQPQTYAQTPPAGGVHNARWQNCGTYAEPIGSENAVHSLEHGAAWITYRPDLPADQVEQLRSLVRGRGYTLLSPYEGLPSPVVVSAWGVQMPVESASDARLEQFLAAYINGPQTPELGASCYGGIGSPTFN